MSHLCEESLDTKEGMCELYFVLAVTMLSWCVYTCLVKLFENFTKFSESVQLVIAIFFLLLECNWLLFAGQKGGLLTCLADSWWF